MSFEVRAETEPCHFAVVFICEVQHYDFVSDRSLFAPYITTCCSESTAQPPCIRCKTKKIKHLLYTYVSVKSEVERNEKIGQRDWPLPVRQLCKTRTCAQLWSEMNLSQSNIRLSFRNHWKASVEYWSDPSFRRYFVFARCLYCLVLIQSETRTRRLLSMIELITFGLAPHILCAIQWIEIPSNTVILCVV